MHHTNFSPTNQKPNSDPTFWLQMELDFDSIVQVAATERRAPARCPMCCSTLQEADDHLLICPTCGLEVML